MHRLKPLLLASAAAFPVFCLGAGAATLCVNTAGSSGCYKHIADAVNAAAANDVIDVSTGTYSESVTILKPLSLNGLGATIDATGLGRGIYVDGIDAPALAKVHITGFTIQNANFEGILVANASSVTIGNNTVLGNNRALVPATGTCPGLDAFETSEQTDCGEGIHLLGADHSIVTHNTVQQNSGGILVSDDTATVHDNLISFNTINGNPYACGISLASHPPAKISGSTAPLGVFHNTVYGNHATDNGTLAGGGAGVGIFASVPFAQTYGNVVVANYLNNNGLPGIAMHAHAPNQILNDNMLVGNVLVGNGADTQDAATPGPAGINLYSVSPVSGNMISGNLIAYEADDVVIKDPAGVQVEFNDLLGPATGVDNLGGGWVDASSNWWGICGAAQFGGCSSAQGASVYATPILSFPVIPLPAF